MDELLRGEFRDPVLIYWLGWWSALFCFGMASTTAWQIRDHPRLFMAMMLFSAAWVLVAAAAAGRLDAIAAVAKQKGQSEQIVRTGNVTILADRAVDVALLLFVFVGAMFAREKREDHWAHKLHWWLLAAALIVLIVLVRPDQLPLRLPQLNETQHELVMSDLLGTIGFASLAVGVLALGTKSQKLWIVVAVVLWETVSLYRTWELWNIPKDASRPPISAELAYSFVILRVVATWIVDKVALRAHKAWSSA